MNEIVGFNYATLSAEERDDVLRHTETIRDRIRKTGEAVVEIGRSLDAVRERIGRASFPAWLAAEFGWNQRTAEQYINAARRFGDLDCLDRFQPAALLTLSRESVPDDVVERAVDQARAGKPVTMTTAGELVRDASADVIPLPAAGAARSRSGDAAGRTPPGAKNGEGRRDADDSAPQLPTVASVEALERAVDTLRSSVSDLLPRLTAAEAATLADRLLDLAFRLRSVGTVVPAQPDPDAAEKPARGPRPVRGKARPNPRARR